MLLLGVQGGGASQACVREGAGCAACMLEWTGVWAAYWACQLELSGRSAGGGEMAPTPSAAAIVRGTQQTMGLNAIVCIVQFYLLIATAPGKAPPRTPASLALMSLSVRIAWIVLEEELG